MTGLDTNVLIRYITQDDSELSPIATSLSCHEGEEVWILF